MERVVASTGMLVAGGPPPAHAVSKKPRDKTMDVLTAYLNTIPHLHPLGHSIDEVMPGRGPVSMETGGRRPPASLSISPPG
jgi:hypothetical protein